MGYAHLYHGGTIAMRQHLRKRAAVTWPGRARHGVARAIGRVLAFPGGIAVLEQAHTWAAARVQEVTHFRTAFEQWRPSVVFCADQRPVELLGPVIAARQLGIPTAAFIFSWDNLTSKGRMAASFDHYLVWSSHMARELRRLYSAIPEVAVHIVGSPQFDAYEDRTLLWNRTDFFHRIGADPGKPLVCYSGGDTTTCPEDPQHVRVLMQLIEARRIQPEPQVILRPTPVDPGRRYADLRGRFPSLFFNQPQWSYTNRSDWMRIVPTREDVRFLANLTYHTDVNVNVASTMTLDFAIRNKPVVNIAFDVGPKPPFGTSLWNWHYQKEHYRPVIELGAARIAKSPDELVAAVTESLREPGAGAEARRQFVDLELGVPVGQSSSRVADVLTRIAGGGGRDID
jgi:hypothetical protein